MSDTKRQIIGKAIAALAEELQPEFIQVIQDLVESEQITEVLIGLGIIDDADQGEILAEGLFTGFSQAMDVAFGFNEDDDCEDCDEDEEEQPKSDINFPCCGNHKNKNTK
jgi:hypothetical protein